MRSGKIVKSVDYFQREAKNEIAAWSPLKVVLTVHCQTVPYTKSEYEIEYNET